MIRRNHPLLLVVGRSSLQAIKVDQLRSTGKRTSAKYRDLSRLDAESLTCLPRRRSRTNISADFLADIRFNIRSRFTEVDDVTLRLTSTCLSAPKVVRSRQSLFIPREGSV